MKGIKQDLQSVVKGLKGLLKKTERIERELDKARAAKARRGRPPVAKGVKPGKQGEKTAMVAVYNIIKRSRKGATTTQIRDATGFDNKKIWNSINRLKTQQKIKSASRGVYVAIR
jgi:transcription initiation factor TFIIIB Brf1 subunit/transcription initiation factor TFIIB